MAVTIEELIEKTLADSKPKSGELDNAKIKEVLTKVAVGGMAPKDAMGFDDNFIAMIYSTAFNHYQSGKYAEGLDIFEVLRALDPADPRYCLGIGACYQKMKKYMEATPYYIAAAALEPSSPLPYYYASECFLKSDNIPGALIMLKMVLQRLIESNDDNSMLKARVEASIAGLEKQIADNKKVAKK